MIKRIKLDRTLRKIAEEGIEIFYNDSITHRIINKIQKKKIFFSFLFNK